MKKVSLSTALFWGVTSLLLLPYLVYALTSASVSVSINSAVNGATSSHSWSTDHPQYHHTDLTLEVRDITNGEPGPVVTSTSSSSTSSSGSPSLNVSWTPVGGHTYKAKASTYVVDNGLGYLAQAHDDDVATK